MSKLYYDPSLPEEVGQSDTPRTDHEQSCDIKLAENDLVRGEFARKLEIELGEQHRLTFDVYQRLSRDTAIYPNVDTNLTYPTLGLCGEAGEVAEKVKKMIRDDNGVMTKVKQDELTKELGDVLYYLAAVASEAKLELSIVAATNIAKLKKRQQEGKLHGSGDNR